MADLKINGISQPPGTAFRQGVNLDTDGTYTLIIWLGLEADGAQNFQSPESRCYSSFRS